jgi:DNA-binding IclR family transcriptional regulator
VESSSTVEKAVDLLFHLHAAGAPLGVTAIGQALGIPKSSAHRMLQSLCGRGLVERDGRGHYRPGFGLLALGLGVQDREPIVAAARPLLESEARKLGETLFLVVARGGELIVLDKVEGTGFLRAAPQVGSSVPVHATAVGKLYLAFDPDSLAGSGSGSGSASGSGARTDFTAAHSRGGMHAFTSETLVDRDSLHKAVSRARERGWASNRDEWIPGLSVVAAPVRAGGRVYGAVALAAPSAKWEELGGDSLGEKLATIARAIAARIDGCSEGMTGQQA